MGKKKQTKKQKTRRCKVQRDWSDTEGGVRKERKIQRTLNTEKESEDTKKGGPGGTENKERHSMEDMEAGLLSVLMSGQQSPCSLKSAVSIAMQRGSV